MRETKIRGTVKRDGRQIDASLPQDGNVLLGNTTNTQMTHLRYIRDEFEAFIRSVQSHNKGPLNRKCDVPDEAKLHHIILVLCK